MGRASELLEREIYHILHLQFEFKLYHRLQKQRPDSWNRQQKWTNRKVDTLIYWCHIAFGGGLFVTDDDNFNKVSKKARLIALAGGDIVRIAEAAARPSSGAAISNSRFSLDRR